MPLFTSQGRRRLWRAWLGVLFSLYCSVPGAATPEQPSLNESSPFVRILITSANDGWIYQLQPENNELTLLSHYSKTDGSAGLLNITAEAGAESGRQYSARTEAARNLMPIAGRRITWASPSPNCRFVLADNNNLPPAIQNFTLNSLMPPQLVKEFHLKGYNFVLDFGWSPDSRFLILMETDERYSVSPLNLLRSLSGHRLPLETISINIVRSDSGESRRQIVASDLPDGEATILGAPTACGPGALQ